MRRLHRASWCMLPKRAAARAASGCPRLRRELTLLQRYRRIRIGLEAPADERALENPYLDPCTNNVAIRLQRLRRNRPPRTVERIEQGGDRYDFETPPPGRYRAVTPTVLKSGIGRCLKARSPILRVR